MKYLFIALLVDITMILTILVLMAKMRIHEQKFAHLKTKLNYMKVQQMLIENKLNKI